MREGGTWARKMAVPSDHAFFRQRLALVEDWLTNPEHKFSPARKGRVRRRTGSDGREDLTYQREARLLRKLLRRTKEGQVLMTLTAWRRQLGAFLREHRRQNKGRRDAYRAWRRLSWEERQRVPEPPKPPPARYVDSDGAPWIIDERFLALIDDLIERLEKWVAEK
jgi:hypothetical protein